MLDSFWDDAEGRGHGSTRQWRTGRQTNSRRINNSKIIVAAVTLGLHAALLLHIHLLIEMITSVATRTRTRRKRQPPPSEGQRSARVHCKWIMQLSILLLSRYYSKLYKCHHSFRGRPSTTFFIQAFSTTATTTTAAA